MPALLKTCCISALEVPRGNVDLRSIVSRRFIKRAKDFFFAGRGEGVDREEAGVSNLVSKVTTEFE